MTHSRRDFLRYLASVTLGGAVVGSLAGSPLWAAPVPKKRVLVLESVHSGKRLEVAYAVGNRYVPDALARLNTFLRDPVSGAVTRMDPRLFDLLHIHWTRFGSKGTFQVISGYRSPSTNAQMRRHSRGVARNSFHTRGKAVDVCLRGVPLTRLRDAALMARVGGVGFYPCDGFVHLDTGPVRTW